MTIETFKSMFFDISIITLLKKIRDILNLMARDLIYAKIFLLVK